ncbi:MAG: hypothetical protein KIT69_19270 [Propionibacteriaceae bacterium]|nr:hypothetical protein [Propionibacteriaceae bacterium]
MLELETQLNEKQKQQQQHQSEKKSHDGHHQDEDQQQHQDLSEDGKYQQIVSQVQHESARLEKLLQDSESLTQRIEAETHEISTLLLGNSLHQQQSSAPSHKQDAELLSFEQWKQTIFLPHHHQHRATKNLQDPSHTTSSSSAASATHPHHAGQPIYIYPDHPSTDKEGGGSSTHEVKTPGKPMSTTSSSRIMNDGGGVKG